MLTKRACWKNARLDTNDQLLEKNGTHAANPAVEPIQQRHASANGEAAQQVVLPAEGEEGVDQSPGSG